LEEPVKLTDDVKQRKQNILDNSVQQNKTEQTKKILVFLIFIYLYFYIIYSPVILWKNTVNLQLIATEGISTVLHLENYP